MDIASNRYHNFFTHILIKFHKTTYDFVQFTSSGIQTLHPNMSTLIVGHLWNAVGMNLM